MSIDPKELRLGSIVRFKGNWPEDDRDAIISCVQSHCVSLDGYRGTPSIADIHPIPLTPELLLKCGFVQEGSEAGDDGAYELGEASLEEGVCLLWIPKEGQYTEKDAIGLWVYRDYMREQLKIDINRVQYLHQLQNIYWCLTGNELTITL